MPNVNLPLSGAVTQTINPWTVYFSAMGSQFGLININLGNSSDPTVEKETLSDVASYGKQLGRIDDALIVLLRHFRPEGELLDDEKKAINALKQMLEGIADVKERHGAQFVLRP